MIRVGVLWLSLGVCSGAACADLSATLRENHWIAYAPTGHYPAEKPPVIPGRASLRADLDVLRAAGFTGLVTYGAHVEAIPEVAAAVGFRAMLLGIWDPFDHGERAAALRAAAAHRDLIAGLVIGNEGLANGRYTVEALCRAMAEIRGASGKPVTTTEPLDEILGETAIGACSDFISVNAHPYFSGQKEPAAAVGWTVEAWQAVRALYPDKPALFKEVGLPTAGDEGLSEFVQKEYYVQLASTQISFCYFEAFDATKRFKDGLIEQSWGLWRSDRTPKAIVEALPWKVIRK